MSNKVKKEIKELMYLINDLFYKNFLKGDKDAITDLYESSKNHVELKLFELELKEKNKHVVRTAIEHLMQKHLEIFYRVHIQKESMSVVIPEVLDISPEELQEISDLLGDKPWRPSNLDDN